MNANSMCISCLLSRQEKAIRDFRDENKKSEYMHKVLEILFQYGRSESAPCLAERINRLYDEFWGAGEDWLPVLVMVMVPRVRF